MQGGSGLVYYGLGRMLSYISPPIIAGVKLNNCNLAIVMDKVITLSSISCPRPDEGM